MRTTYYYKIDPVTRANFQNAKMSVSEMMSDRDSKNYALRCYSTVAVSSPEEGRLFSHGVAYFIPGEGKFIADINHEGSREGVKHLATYLLDTSEAKPDDIFPNFNEILTAFEWDLPEEGSAREKALSIGIDKMDRIIKAFSKGEVISKELISPPESPKPSVITQEKATPIKISPPPSILKSDPTFAKDTATLLCMALTHLPKEQQHLFQLLTSKVAEPMGMHLRILQSTDVTRAEKKLAQEGIKQALKNLAREIIKNSDMGSVKLVTTTMAVNSIIEKVTTHIFNLSNKNQLGTTVGNQIGAILPLIIRGVNDISSGKSKENVITQLIIEKLRGPPSAPLSPTSTPTFFDTAKNTLTKKVVGTVVSMATSTKVKEEDLSFAHRLCKKDMDGKNELQQRQLLFAKLDEIEKGRAVVSTLLKRGSTTQSELTAVLAQLRYKELVYEQQSQKTRGFSSLLFKDPSKEKLMEVNKLKHTVREMIDAVKKGESPLSVRNEKVTASSELSDIAKQINLILTRGVSALETTVSAAFKL